MPNPASKSVAGLQIVGIPYAGGAQVVRDLPGGTIQLYFGSAATTLPLIKAEKLHALVTRARRTTICCRTSRP
jgi:tripartite-type tricarboxylate transporter receptor subunit TctC